MKKLVIAGGGSSGWMCALFLNKVYNQNNKTIDITVIESKDIDIIGVGEATVPTIRGFFQAIGVDESELIRETSATYKTGIKFNHWMKPDKSGKSHSYLHPFEQQLLENRFDLPSCWAFKGHQFGGYSESVSVTSELIKYNHSPKGIQSQAYQGVVPYGYHLDARLLGKYLRKKALAQGVNHIEAKIEKINHKDSIIESLETEVLGSIEGDFFIDCTGFRALLISELENDNWRSYADELLCDKAVAIQIPFDATQTANAYTTATALSNGWAWNIGLKDRQGCGYVYSSKNITSSEAEAELRSHIQCGDEHIARHLDMNIGVRKKHWIGNCLAVGLSAGFIEPLESTGLHLISLSARLFASHFSSFDVVQEVKDSYNNLLNGIFDDLKEFIALHYVLSDRDDTEFWVNASKAAENCPRLMARLTLWKHKVCDDFDLHGDTTQLFRDVNYKFILFGMKYLPETDIEYANDEYKTLQNEIVKRKKLVLTATMGHKQALEFAHNTQGSKNETIKIPR
jgi:tryptophan halogenase